MSGGHLCEAEAPTEATAETSAPPEENETEINGCPRYEIYCKTVGAGGRWPQRTVNSEQWTEKSNAFGADI